MADLVHLRHSTDKQTDARQRHALTALLAAGAPVYEDPATSSRQLSRDRAGFTTLLHEAAIGDTTRIAGAARLFRAVADILARRPVLIRRGLHLRVESGLLSGSDLTSDDLGTKMMASVLAAVSDTDATLDLPGLLAGHLRTTGDETVRQALASGHTIRSGHGYSVRITAPLALHRAALEQSAALADAGPTERKAHRVYAARVTVVQATRLHPPCPGETLRRDAFERKPSLRRSHIRPLRPGGTRSFTLRRRRPWLILTDHVEGAGGGVIVSAREASLMIRDCAAVLTFSRPRCRSAMS